jgi:VWFA-related protein
MRVALLAGFAWALVAAMTLPADAQRGARATVHVAVEDAAGNPAGRLAADAFSLSVDGAAQPIDSVVPAAQPLTLIVLVDRSQSMTMSNAGVDAPVKRFAAALGAADRWRVGTFADRILFSRDFVAGPRSFQIAPRDPIVVRERRVRGGSPLWDALHQSIELLAPEPGRRTVMVFTDARASGNEHGLDDVAELAVDASVAVNAIVPVAARGIRQDARTMAVVTPAASLDRLSRYTGGVLRGGFDLEDGPTRQIERVAARLRSAYAVTFAAPADGRRHRLEVRVAVPGLQVRAPMAFRAVTP